MWRSLGVSILSWPLLVTWALAASEPCDGPITYSCSDPGCCNGGCCDTANGCCDAAGDCGPCCWSNGCRPCWTVRGGVIVMQRAPKSGFVTGSIFTTIDASDLNLGA